MSYIECPACGKKALSVATRCPHCSLIFTPGMIEQATPPAESNRLRRLLVMAGALVVLAVVAVVLQDRMGSTADTAPPVANGPVSQPLPPDTASQAEEEPPVVATPAPTRAQPLDTARSIRAQLPPPSRDSVVDSTPPPQPLAVPAQPTPSPPIEAPAAPTDQQLQRYAKTWVNVRGGRSRSASAVRVLNPGETVLVDSLVRGWYRVVIDGQPVGYVDRTYLDVEAP